MGIALQAQALDELLERFERRALAGDHEQGLRDCPTDLHERAHQEIDVLLMRHTPDVGDQRPIVG